MYQTFLGMDYTDNVRAVHQLRPIMERQIVCLNVMVDGGVKMLRMVMSEMN